MFCGVDARAQAPSIAAQWAVYRARFMQDDGRIVDTGNNKVSHTEGQGFAMLAAAAAGDGASFAKMWNWTRDKLQRKDNALFSWRYDPGNEEKPVADPNDATDGDMLIAWALARAGRNWNEPEYTREATRIAAEIRKKLVVRASGRTVLLPGKDGFKSKDGPTVINPSYYIYPAIDEFARLAPSSQWAKLRRDGLELLAEARYGRWGLTPDWLDLDRKGEVGLPEKYPARFGFEAIRVPLYLIWGGQATEARLASYLDFWNDYGGKPIPAWADLKNNSVAPYAGSTGVQAIVQLARNFGQSAPNALPGIGDQDDYYSASLTLLASVALQEKLRH